MASSALFQRIDVVADQITLFLKVMLGNKPRKHRMAHSQRLKQIILIMLGRFSDPGKLHLIARLLKQESPQPAGPTDWRAAKRVRDAVFAIDIMANYHDSMANYHDSMANYHDSMANYHDSLPAGPGLSGLLDFGCGESGIALAMAAALGIPDDRVHGCDIVPLRYQPEFTFNLVEKDRPLPYDAGQFGIVTAFMSLHHATTLHNEKTVFDELARVLQPNGFLLVREHGLLIDGAPMSPQDAAAFSVFANIFHAIYACTEILKSPPEGTPEEFMQAYHQGYANYLNMFEWIRLAEESGFKLMGRTVNGNRDMFGVVHMLFQRTDTVKKAD